MYRDNFLVSRLSRVGSANLKNQLMLQPELQRTSTYVDFFLNAERSAQFLVDLGVKPKDKVLIYAEKSAASIELYFGCLLVGAVYTPINPAISIEDIDYFIEDATPVVVMMDKVRLAAYLKDHEATSPVFTINADETGSFIDARGAYPGGFDAIQCDASDPAAILYTSGTTGRPKGVIHTHGSLWSNAEVLKRTWEFSSEDVLLHVLPIFHLHGL